MNASSDRPALRINSVPGLLAAIPHLLGFTPTVSLVVVGSTAAGGVQLAFRYDLPDPPDSTVAGDIASHAMSVLARKQLTIAIAVGYGPGRLVTPLADALRVTAPRTKIRLHDMLRVEDGRYWSYLCTSPECCPAEGVPFYPATHPAARALAAAGQSALPDRDALAATIAPFAGPDAERMRKAAQRAERAASRLVSCSGLKALENLGLSVVGAAIETYRKGESVVPAARHAWLALVLTRLRVRDDAWARMDPMYRDAHHRLWIDLVRRAQPGYIAAPACLLAFTAWQGGEGALANIALDRALADDPAYSMALLLRDILDAGTPPSAAILPLTPEQVAESYATAPQPNSGSSQDPGADDASAVGGGPGTSGT